MAYEDTLRQYLEAAIPSRSVSLIPLERDQETPPYEGTDETQQTLARLLGPLPNSPQLQEPPSLPPPSSYPWLANAPRELSDAELYEGMEPAEILLRREFGPTAEIGWGDRFRARMNMSPVHGGQMLNTLAQQRAIAAREAQSQAAQHEQRMEEQVIGIWKDQTIPKADKKKLSDEFGRKGITMATNLSRLANEDLIGQADILRPYLPPGKFEELTQLLRTPNADLSPVEHWFKFAQERHDATKKEEFQSQRFADLSRQLADGTLSPAGIDELQKMVGERKKRQEDLAKLKLDIQNLGLDVAAKSLSPRPMGSYQEGPETVENVFDPRTNTVKEVRGQKTPGVQVNMGKDRTITLNDAARVSSLISGAEEVGKTRELITLPDGTVDRSILFQSFASVPWSQGRNLSNWMEDAIKSKVYAETGVAARSDEVESAMRRFSPKQLDNDTTIFNKLNGFEKWIVTALNVFDPDGEIRSRAGYRGTNLIGPPPNPPAQEFQRLQKAHPDWSKEQLFEEMIRRGY